MCTVHAGVADNCAVDAVIMSRSSLDNVFGKKKGNSFSVSKIIKTNLAMGTALLPHHAIVRRKKNNRRNKNHSLRGDQTSILPALLKRLTLSPFGSCALLLRQRVEKILVFFFAETDFDVLWYTAV